MDAGNRGRRGREGRRGSGDSMSAELIGQELV